MSALASGAARLTRGWVWLYTLGLTHELRLERRAEIESDIWEQRVAAAARRASGTRAALATLARCLLGMPADLSWRAEQSRAIGLPGAALRLLLALLQAAERPAGWVERRGLPGLTIALGGLYALLGLVVIATIPINDAANARPGQFVAFGLLCLAAASAIVAGSRRIEARPLLGAALVCCGAGLMGLVLFTTLIAPLTTLLVIFSALRRALSARRMRAATGG